MQRCKHISASVLATVLVVSALMLLLVFGVLALWEADFVFFREQDMCLNSELILNLLSFGIRLTVL